MKPDGMSEKAWIKLHETLARLEVKYQDQLRKKADSARREK
jgi:hypothetical protein